MIASNGQIFVINPGSTSTKLGLYNYDLHADTCIRELESTLHHQHTDELQQISDQVTLRLNAVHDFLNEYDIGDRIRLIMARGGPLHPMEGGIYAVNSAMLDDLSSCRYANHASNLGALVGNELAKQLGVSVYIADPVTVDEFPSIARISGVPEIERKSRSHALNIKASAREVVAELEIPFEDARFVIAHMGGGISVAALNKGQIVDVNDALLGMGPFSPERAGALPLAGLIKLAFSGDFTEETLKLYLSKNSGLKAYLGTSNLIEIEEKISQGDQHADHIFQAMIYQIAKEIGAMAAVLNFELDAIILTGGMARSSRLIDSLTRRIKALGEIVVLPGERELEALAQAGFRLLSGREEAKEYFPEIEDS